MNDDNSTAQASEVEDVSMGQEIKSQIHAQVQTARQQAINGAGSLLGAQSLIDPEWQAREDKRQREYLRTTAVEKAMGSYVVGDHPTAEDIVARAKVIEAYPAGDA